jgi:pimeloyl-ACP methyl ester carboxylesterase
VLPLHRRWAGARRRTRAAGCARPGRATHNPRPLAVAGLTSAGVDGLGPDRAGGAQGRTPVHVVTRAHDDLVPPSNGRHLAQWLPDSQLSILDTGHFPWEQIPYRYAAILADAL